MYGIVTMTDIYSSAVTTTSNNNELHLPYSVNLIAVKVYARAQYTDQRKYRQLFLILSSKINGHNLKKALKHDYCKVTSKQTNLN